MNKTLYWPDKNPDAIQDYMVDWSADLTTDETLFSATWIFPDDIVKETSPPEAIAEGNKCVVWISGGVHGKIYRIELHVVTDQGRTFCAYIEMACARPDASATGAAVSAPPGFDYLTAAALTARAEEAATDAEASEAGAAGQAAAAASSVTTITALAASFVSTQALLTYDQSLITQDQLLNFRRGLGAVWSGAGNCKVLCLGDSTTRGRNNLVDAGAQAAQSYPTFLASMLAQLGVQARADSFLGTGNLSPLGDSRVVTTMTGNGGTLGGSAFFCTAAANLVFSPGVSWDTADIYYVRSGTVGWNYQIGGGGAISPAVTGTAGPHVLTISKAAGTESLTINWVTGTLRVVGINCYNAGTKQISVFNGGISGAQASGSLGTNISTGPQTWLTFLAPNLTILDFGINEYIAGTSKATFKANMQTLIDTLVAAGSDVLLKTFLPNGTASAGVAQSDLVAATRELASENDLPLIDLHRSIGSYAEGNTAGLYSNVSHANSVGYADIARFVARVLR